MNRRAPDTSLPLSHTIKQISLVLVFILLLTGFMSLFVLGQGSNEPVGPDIIFNATEEGPQRPATSIVTSGGTITTIVLDAVTQNPHWKGFVGNVTGTLALQDAVGNSLYEWALTTVSGKVYVSRNESVNWTAIGCANATHVESEDIAMSHDSSSLDSINRTFIEPGSHPAFSTAATNFGADECNYTINTYVNGTSQNSEFFEILLSDGDHLVYTSPTEGQETGFDTNSYDFQMIVAENGSTSAGTSTTYFFYVELV